MSFRTSASAAVSSVRATLSLAVFHLVLAVARFFDGGVSGIASAFTRLDRDLDRFIARQFVRIEQEQKAREASNARVRFVQDTEAAFRVVSHGVEDDLHHEVARAVKIKNAIAKLIGD